MWENENEFEFLRSSDDLVGVFGFSGEWGSEMGSIRKRFNDFPASCCRKMVGWGDREGVFEVEVFRMGV